MRTLIEAAPGANRGCVATAARLYGQARRIGSRGAAVRLRYQAAESLLPIPGSWRCVALRGARVDTKPGNERLCRFVSARVLRLAEAEIW